MVGEVGRSQRTYLDESRSPLGMPCTMNPEMPSTVVSISRPQANDVVEERVQKARRKRKRMPALLRLSLSAVGLPWACADHPRPPLRLQYNRRPPPCIHFHLHLTTGRGENVRGLVYLTPLPGHSPPRRVGCRLARLYITRTCSKHGRSGERREHGGIGAWWRARELGHCVVELEWPRRRRPQKTCRAPRRICTTCTVMQGVAG